MKQRIIPLLLLLLVFLPIRAQAEEDGPAAMILYEPRTKTVLEALNPDEPMLIASTTKIMTAMVVLENCTLRESVAVTKAHTDVEGSSALLQAGETYTVEELLYGLMLASGNDAALALAEHTAGSVEGFAALMNAKAEALGLENTHFANPHGLNAPDHFSTARDLALMTAAAMPFTAPVNAADTAFPFVIEGEDLEGADLWTSIYQTELPGYSGKGFWYLTASPASFEVTVPEDAMYQLFKYINREYKNIENFLYSCGVSEKDVFLIRQKLIG